MEGAGSLFDMLPVSHIAGKQMHLNVFKVSLGTPPLALQRASFGA